MEINLQAGHPATQDILVNIPRLITAYYTGIPDPNVREQQVAFGFKDSNLQTKSPDDLSSDIFRTNTDNMRKGDEESRYMTGESNEFVTRRTEQAKEYRSLGEPKYIYEQNQEKLQKNKKRF